MDLARIDPSRLHRREDLGEEPELIQAGSQIFLIGAGEVGVDALQLQGGLLGDPLQQRRSVLGGQAHASHTGVDLDLHRERRAMLAGGLGEQTDVAGVLDHRRHGQLEHVRRLGSVVDTAQDEDPAVDGCSSELGCLGDRHHRQVEAARRDQPARHGDRPVSVAIRLHHGDDVAIATEAPRLGVVGCDGLEIDRRRGRTLALHTLLRAPLQPRAPGDHRITYRNSGRFQRLGLTRRGPVG